MDFVEIVVRAIQRKPECRYSTVAVRVVIGLLRKIARQTVSVQTAGQVCSSVGQTMVSIVHPEQQRCQARDVLVHCGRCGAAGGR